MSYWTVAQTETQRERVAALHLAKAGFEIYLPLIKQRKLIAPMFPNYIFINVVDRWYKINATIGVRNVLLSGDEPAKLRDENFLIELRARQDRHGIIKLPKQAPKLGQKVRIIAGSFFDHIGIYDGQGSKDREAVLLSLLGRMVRIELRASDLQFAS